MISSARVSTEGGMVSPIAFAVLGAVPAEPGVEDSLALILRAEPPGPTGRVAEQGRADLHAVPG